MSRFLPDILGQHLEELDELLARRAHGFRTGAPQAKQVVDLDARILAHADGLVVAGTEALPLLRQALEEGDPGQVVGAAFALTRSPEEGVAAKAVAQLGSAGDAEALALAARYAPAAAGAVDVELERLAREGTPQVAGVALAALARRDRLAGPQPLTKLLEGDDAGAARWALEAVAHLPGGEHEAAAATGRMGSALRRWARESEGATREAALHAAAWTAQQWLPAALRSSAAEPAGPLGPEHALLAALGDPEDLEWAQALAANEALGPARFGVLALHGHPKLLPLLVTWMESQDPATAAVAADAYTLLSGAPMFVVGKRVSANPDDDFAEDHAVPDLPRARAHCASTEPAFAAEPRWLRGRPEPSWHPLDGELTLAERVALGVGRRMRGAWDGRRASIDAFPLQTGAQAAPPAARRRR